MSCHENHEHEPVNKWWWWFPHRQFMVAQQCSNEQLYIEWPAPRCDHTCLVSFLYFVFHKWYYTDLYRCIQYCWAILIYIFINILYTCTCCIWIPLHLGKNNVSNDILELAEGFDTEKSVPNQLGCFSSWLNIKRPLRYQWNSKDVVHIIYIYLYNII